MAELLLGKPVADAIAQRLGPRIEVLAQRGVVPTLAIVRVGERPDDLSYERGAAKRAEALGIALARVVLPADATQADILSAIEDVNHDDSIHGCLLFRPLPDGIDEMRVCNALRPEKDIDGITAASLAGVFMGLPEGHPPCTAQACIEMLDHYGIEIAGRRVVVVGRSLVIGKPVAMMLLARNATVTLCHSRSEELARICREADLVVYATGRARAYGLGFFAQGQTIIDVGINVDESGELCGDVDIAAAEPLVGAVTPVPRGVGSVTTAVLMAHVVEAAEAAAGAKPTAR